MQTFVAPGKICIIQKQISWAALSHICRTTIRTCLRDSKGEGHHSLFPFPLEIVVDLLEIEQSNAETLLLTVESLEPLL